jgi:hypothetical protein
MANKSLEILEKSEEESGFKDLQKKKRKSYRFI